jgi:hypothetical protein
MSITSMQPAGRFHLLVTSLTVLVVFYTIKIIVPHMEQQGVGISQENEAIGPVLSPTS